MKDTASVRETAKSSTPKAAKPLSYDEVRLFHGGEGGASGGGNHCV
jgi:hypothetical protein